MPHTSTQETKRRPSPAKHTFFVEKYIANPKFWLILFIDVLLVTAAHLLAYELRFDTISARQVIMLKHSLPIILPVKIILFFLFHLYSGLWRYTGPRDLVKIFGANISSTLCIIAIVGIQYRFIDFSRSVILIDFLVSVSFICLFRLGIRVYYFPNQIRHILRLKDFYSKNKKRLLIIGAGAGGEKLLSTIFENEQLYNRYVPVGILDDDPKKIGNKIHGVPILNRIDFLPHLIAKEHIDEIMIAVSRAKAESMRKIVRRCEEVKIPFRIVPRLEEFVLGQGSTAPIRDVSYEDLLGREPIEIDYSIVQDQITGKVVLITGGGGSIGSELCRQICRFTPKLIILLEISEYNLYRIERSVRTLRPDITIIPYIGSVVDSSLVEAIMQRHSPDVVFHAAAYKHVPMVEINPFQAVNNNVFGTAEAVRLARAYKVGLFVFISTDKAVNPHSLMGATKRLGELIIRAQMLQNRTRFIIVRFGNVVGSDGSVVPMFLEQIKNGGPVTVTHREMTRFFMSIKEAVLLVLQAASMGKGGETYILDMGKPIKILNMAEDLIRLAGKNPYDDIDIVFTGVRPGEKLTETLLFENEESLPTRHSKIHMIQPVEVDQGFIEEKLLNLKKAMLDGSVPDMTEVLRDLIPEYTPSDLLSESILSGNNRKVLN